MNIDTQTVKPGGQIELRMSGRVGTYVGLAAYDQGSLDYKENHDLFWEEMLRVYNGIDPSVNNEFAMFHSMGLFVRTFDIIIFNEARDMSARNGWQTSKPITKPISPKSNNQESWLWQNVTIGRNGTSTTIANVPDEISSWNVMGFSIDPKYGLAIMKEPIQLTSFQPFYIVESLPHSINIDEEVELRFTLFNYFENEHMADVTLYNVANQKEFVGRPLDDQSYTQSIRVPPYVGVPISFLVKARKPGEMVVRVKASINLGMETDAVEKVIPVNTETFLRTMMESHIFYFDRYANETFRMNLHIPPEAVSGPIKIKFRVNGECNGKQCPIPILPNCLFLFVANLLTTIDNLNNLLTVSYGNGERNMVGFAPNIVVLDYLHAIGSKDQSLFDKATNLLGQGYQNQIRYHKTDGSFSEQVYKRSSVFLTAFVAKSMHIASKYISEVDPAMLERAYDWLASKQDRSGWFNEVGTVYNPDMKGGLRNGISLTSYVVTALLENENAKVKHEA
uniref:Alpha-2-macroglobulin domain-containing protein n=1 Tax=Anopheles culicifacies TaxID=139723 RepID=A0A182MNQ7_9DIPT